MENEPIYLKDSYAKECDAKVISVKDGKFITLDTNLFYPKGGGQPHDTGKLVRGEDEFKVVFTGKFEGKISLELDKEGLSEGEQVHCILDWGRRYKLMRSHTAAHVLASILNKDTGALITGNQIEEDKVRFDFSLENFDRVVFEGCIKKANDRFLQDVAIKTYYLPREEAMKIEGIVKLANALPPSIQTLRIVQIGEIDIQADGGTHLQNLKEVGQIELIKAENKGKSNRRIYFKLV